MFSSYPRSSASAGPGAVGIDWRRGIAWLLLAGLAQATLVHFVAIRGAVPSLVLLAVATYVSRSSLRGALLFGALAGLLEDALAANTGAAWTIATTLVAVGIAASSRILFVDSVSIFAGLVVVAVLVREGLYWTVLSMEGYPVGLGVHYAKIALAAALYTAFAAVILGWLRWRLGAAR